MLPVFFVDIYSTGIVTVHSWTVHCAARSQAVHYWGWNPASCRKATFNRPDLLL